MKLIKFGTWGTFYDWFWRGKRHDNYPLIEINYPHCWEEDTHIYRAVENGKDVGVIFISCCYPGEMWIDLFEIRDGYHKKGLGKEMFRLLMEKHKPNYIQLQCVEERDKSALTFWRKMGFHKERYDRYDDNIMHKSITKKYWKNYGHI